MRKHEVQCQIEEENERFLHGIQSKVNGTYAKAVAEVLKKSNLSKEGQIYMLDQIQANFKNL